MISMYAQYSGRTLYVALSTDTIEGAKNGDTRYEMDTGKRYVYNETSDSWDEQPEEGGGGGEYTVADFGDPTKPEGRVVYPGAYIGTQNQNQSPLYFSHRTGITSFYGPNYNNTANNGGTFSDCTNMQYLVLPKLTKIYNSFVVNCFSLLAIDILGGSITGSSLQFGNCRALKTFVIRKSDGVCSLGNLGAFSGTPFASNGTGGTLYAPQALIESYQNATNWSTILSYTNNQILPIEGSIYETQYADGTPIQGGVAT